MVRVTTAALLALVVLAPTAHAQDLATRRANRTLQAQEKELLHAVAQRLETDKKVKGSMVTVSAKPDGVIVLKGSLANEAAKDWVIALVENTVGVQSVVDELAVVKSVKVYDARKDDTVVEVGKPVSSEVPATRP